MLMAFWQVQRLTREIHSIEKAIIQKHNTLSNYQKYASRLGGSSIMGLNNIAGLSVDLLPRASLFAQYSDQASSMSAMQNLQAMKAMGRVPITNNPAMQMQIEMSAYNQFKQQALKDLKQQEVAIMSEKENEIQLELNELETRLKMKQSQLNSYKQLSEKEAEESAPKF